MRVFFDDPAFHIETRGGVSRHVALLARLLAESGEAEVHVFAGWNGNRFGRELAQTPRLRVHRLPRPPQLRINGLARGISAVWRRVVAAGVFRSPTIYHGSFYPLDPQLAVRASATVCTLYDMIPEMYPVSGRSAQRYRSDKEAAARLATHLLAISESTARDAERLFPWIQGRTTVVPLTTDLFGVAAAARPSVAPPGNYFLMVGQRDSYKNGALALRAFAAVAAGRPGLRLVLCGGVPRREETALIADLGLAERVDFIAPDDAWLRTHYENALGLLYPSRHEGFGLPVLEAMLCGCPVVTTPLTSIPEVAGEAALYAGPDDVATFAAHLRTLLDPVAREFRGGLGRKRAELFRPEAHVRRMLDFYRAVMSAR